MVSLSCARGEKDEIATCIDACFAVIRLETTMTDEQIFEAFHAMWDNFPESVMLIKKSREILALNPKCAELGLKVGMKCSSIGKPENHKGRRCNKAIDTGAPEAVSYQAAFGKAYGFWIPVAGKPEWIIHFNVGITREYDELTPTIQSITDLK